MSGTLKNAVIQTSLGVGASTGNYILSKDENALASDLVNVGAWEGIELGLKSTLSKKTAVNAIGKVSEQVGKTLVSQTTTAAKGAAVASTLGASSSTLAAGPVGVAIIVIQLGGILVDIFADPYYSYDNKTLRDIKKKYEDALKDTLQELNISYPVKASVSMVNYDSNGNLKLDSETLKYFKEYLEENGLYLKDENEDLAIIAKKVKTSRLFKLSSTTDLNLFSQINYDTTYNNYLLTAASILLIRSIKNKQQNNEYKKQKIQFYTVLLIYGTIVYIFINQLLN